MATLFIGTWNSTCGACSKGADPRENTHDTVLGYGPKEAGCGAEFTDVTSTYVGLGIEDAVRAMRPDLPYRD